MKLILQLSLEGDFFISLTYLPIPTPRVIYSSFPANSYLCTTRDMYTFPISYLCPTPLSNLLPTPSDLRYLPQPPSCGLPFPPHSRLQLLTLLLYLSPPRFSTVSVLFSFRPSLRTSAPSSLILLSVFNRSQSIINICLSTAIVELEL